MTLAQVFQTGLCFHYLEDGEFGFGGRLFGGLGDGENLQGRGGQVEVSEAGILQVMEVSLGECVPDVGGEETYFQSQSQNPLLPLHDCAQK